MNKKKTKKEQLKIIIIWQSDRETLDFKFEYLKKKKSDLLKGKKSKRNKEKQRETK